MSFSRSYLPSLSWFTLTTLCFGMTCTSLVAQQRYDHPDEAERAENNDKENPCIDIDDKRNCWHVDPITGLRHVCQPDTSYLGLAHRQTMAGLSPGLLHTGNLFSPHLVQNMLDRKRPSDFLFVNAYTLFAHRLDEVRYFDTRLPYTTAAYTTSGSSLQSNDRLRLAFAGNATRKVGIGTFLDYVYARGEYTSEAQKPLNWTSYLYYNGTRYKANLTYNLSKLGGQENGGIQERAYVLTPDLYDDSFTEPRNMAVNLDNTWNDIDSWNLHLNHSYDLGTWHERTRTVGDSVFTEDYFVPVASLFHSVDYIHHRRRFRMDEGADLTDNGDYFAHHYIDNSVTQDSTLYSSFSTYAGIRLNEGFSRWSQCSLAAFVGYERQAYSLMQDTTAFAYIPAEHVSNNLFVGGELSRSLSSAFTFDVKVRLGLSGDKVGDVDLTGQAQTVIPIGKKDSLVFGLSGYFRNEKVSYLMEHYFSNHFKWSEDFSPEQHVHLAGHLSLPRTGTSLRVGLDHISNYHYFSADDGLPHESSASVQVIAAELSQRLAYHILHFDNKVLFQTTTQKDVLPLPTLVWQSDLNLQFCIAHSLTLQMGCAAVYTTKYYAPSYQPATQQFAVQHDIECGNFPTLNAYINCNLKRIKFYFMYSGLGTQMLSNDAFLMPYYPLQSSRMEYGVIFDLQN